MKVFDYLIVGNSILGLTTAYRLIQSVPHANIGIIGPPHRTGGATVAAGAMLGLFGEVTAASSAHKYDRACFQLAHQAQVMWPEFVNDINSQIKTEDAVQIHPHGTFILAHAQDTRDQSDYQTIRHALVTYREPYEDILPADIPGLSAEAAARATAGVYIPGERSINPISVLQALEQIFNNHPHVTRIHHTATRLRTKTSGHATIAGVTLDNGETLHADQVILAAGVECQTLLDTLPAIAGRIPHIMAGDGVAFVLDQQALGTEQIQHVIRTPNRTDACSLHVVPNVKDPHLLYLGAGNMIRWRPQPGASVGSATWIMQSGLRDISAHLSQARLLRFNQGNRPTTVDGYPLLGACTSIQGLWLLTGTGRDGFQRAPMLSQQIVSQLTGTRSATDFNTFAPERLPLQTCDQQQAIAQLQHNICDISHQPQAVTDLYAQLDTSLALPAATLLPILYRRWSADLLKHYLDAARQAHA
ncbi:MAG: FAD-binding oxidoreductase [Pseudomonadota bacterium]